MPELCCVSNVCDLSRPIAVYSVRECFLAVGNGMVTKFAADSATATEAARIGKIMSDHPIIGLVMQNMILRRYRRATGNSLDAGVDWTSFLEWFVENLPMLLEALMSILVLFGD